MLLGILNSQAAGGAFNYWLASLGGASDDYGTSVTADSSDNIYSSSFTFSVGAGSGDGLLVKYDLLGVVQWQRTLGGTGSDRLYATAKDSSDNIYVAGETVSEGAGSQDVLLAKYNSSGVIQWQRILGGSLPDAANGLTVDSSDNVYLFGQTQSAGAGSNDLLLAKYNSSGTLQWQRILGGTGGEFGYGVATDASGNAYVLGRTNSDGAGSNDLLLAKYNSSGTLQWQRVLGGAGGDQGRTVLVNSSGDIYALGYFAPIGEENSLLLAKYNSSGTLQWQRSLSGTATNGVGAALDSLGNIYVIGSTNNDGAGEYDFLIAKYNSSGTIQWQRVLGGSLREAAYGISTDSSDNVIVTGRTPTFGEGGFDILLGKLPNDGSLTGTYELDGLDIVYAASTLTAGTSTLTAATSSLTAATSTLTAATSTLTDASASLTEHIVGIG